MSPLPPRLSPRPSLFFPLLVLLLLLSPSQTSASQPPAIAKLRSLQSELALSARASRCHSTRARRIARAQARLSAARKCRYAGLSTVDYLAKRKICKNRSEARTALSKCKSRRAHCSDEQRAVDLAVNACSDIGWDDSDKREECPRIDSAKAALSAAEARKCPAIGRPIAEIKADLEVAAEEARIALSLPPPAYESLVVEPANEKPNAVVFVLHGLGGTAIDAREDALFFQRTGLLPGVRFVLPQAPVQFVTLTNLTVPSWFDLLSDQADGPQAEDEVIAAASNIDGLMEIQRRVYGIDPERIIVIGTSQGGALTTTVYLRHKIAAGVTFSGYLPIDNTYPAGLSDASENAPILMFHGDLDETVPFSVGQLSANVMKALGRDVTFVELPGEPHTYTPETDDIVRAQASRFSADVLGL